MPKPGSKPQPFEHLCLWGFRSWYDSKFTMAYVWTGIAIGFWGMTFASCLVLGLILDPEEWLRISCADPMGSVWNYRLYNFQFLFANLYDGSYLVLKLTVNSEWVTFAYWSLISCGIVYCFNSRTWLFSHRPRLGRSTWNHFVDCRYWLERSSFSICVRVWEYNCRLFFRPINEKTFILMINVWLAKNTPNFHVQRAT